MSLSVKAKATSGAGAAQAGRASGGASANASASGNAAQNIKASNKEKEAQAEAQRAARAKDASSAQAEVVCVELDAIVVMKVIQHCADSLPDSVTGALLGLDEAGVLRCTNAFPFPASLPTSATAADDDASGAGGNAAAAAAAAVEEASLEYQFQMMRCLRDVNVDSHAVGWYQSTFLGSYLTQAMIDTQYQYQSQIKNAVVLIYDPIKSNQGTVALQAFRLTPAFMHIYASRDYTKQSFEQRGLTFSSIFTEVPIRVHANILTQVLLRQLDGAAEVDTANHVLSLNASSFLEKNLELLIESIDDLTVEQSKFAKYAQITLRHTQLIATWQARRRTENAARLARGEKPLSETKEDAMAELNIKFPQEPSRLEALLLSRQLAGYCSALTDEAESSEAKLRAVEALRHAAAK